MGYLSINAYTDGVVQQLLSPHSKFSPTSEDNTRDDAAQHDAAQHGGHAAPAVVRVQVAHEQRAEERCGGHGGVHKRERRSIESQIGDIIFRYARGCFLLPGLFVRDEG